MIEQFLNCPISDVYSCYYLEDLLKPLQPMGAPSVVDFRNRILDYRETDLTAQAEVVRNVVEEAFFHDQRLLCSTDNNYFAMNQDMDVPFPDEPRIGFHGWHQIDDDIAVVLLPVDIGDEGNGGIFTYGIMVTRSASQKFVVYGGGLIRTRPEGAWTVMNFAAMDPDVTDVDALYDRISNMQGDGIEEYARISTLQLLLSKTIVLLCHTIITADPSILRTSTQPKKLRAANAKRGKRTPSGKRWIHLPGLRYDSRTGRWSADPKTPGGVRWHRVRGTYRVLTSERFVNKKGQRVWVRPHTRGVGEHGPQAGYRAG